MEKDMTVKELMNFLAATATWPDYVKVMAWDVWSGKADELTLTMADIAAPKFTNEFTFMRAICGRPHDDVGPDFWGIVKEALAFDDMCRYLPKDIK